VYKCRNEFDKQARADTTAEAAFLKNREMQESDVRYASGSYAASCVMITNQLRTRIAPPFPGPQFHSLGEVSGLEGSLVRILATLLKVCNTMADKKTTRLHVEDLTDNEGRSR
jgi:hypothetical protein